MKGLSFEKNIVWQVSRLNIFVMVMTVLFSFLLVKGGNQKNSVVKIERFRVISQWRHRHLRGGISLVIAE